MSLVGIFPKDMVGPRYEQNDLVALFPVGSSSKDNQGATWTYVSFSAAVAQYDTVWFDENFAALTVLNATTPASQRPAGIGLAQVAAPTGVSYGWVWGGGNGCGGIGTGLKANVLVSCIKDTPLYATSTAGKLDDSSTAHYQILGLTTTATEPGTGTAAIEVFAALPLALSGV